MTAEERVLNVIQGNQPMTQRMLANQTGMSLGNINLLIKRLVEKGLVKIEHLNTRTLRYILTPKGMAEKARLAYAFFRISCRYILSIETVLVQSILREQPDVILLFGEDDEVKRILINRLQGMQVSYKEIKLKQMDTIADEYQQQRVLLIYWDHVFMTLVSNAGIPAINIIENVDHINVM